MAFEVASTSASIAADTSSVYSAMAWVISTASSSMDIALDIRPTLLTPQLYPHAIVVQTVNMDNIVLSLHLLLGDSNPHLVRRHSIRNVRLRICVIDRHGS